MKNQKHKKLLKFCCVIFAYSCFTLSANTYLPLPVAGAPGLATGDPGAPAITDGSQALLTSFNQPSGIAIDSSGNIFVADAGNNIIRKITSVGTVSTFASQYNNNGVANDGNLTNPRGIAIDNSSSDIYVANYSSHNIVKITSAGSATRFAGSDGTVLGATDGNGGAASFTHPRGVTVDSTGNIYVADRSNHLIRKITPAADVSTIAGNPGSIGTTDGTGAAARFNLPNGITVDSSTGNIYVADTENHTIRKITSGGDVSTFAGTAGDNTLTDGTGAAARFNLPKGITVDSNGNIYVADTGNKAIRKITPAGVVSTIFNVPDVVNPMTGAVMATAAPTGITVDNSTGIIYVADAGTHVIFGLIPIPEAVIRAFEEFLAKVRGISPGVMSKAANSTIENAVDVSADYNQGGDNGEERGSFRFGLQSHQIKMKIRSLAPSGNPGEPHGKTIHFLEKTLSDTHALRQINNFTIWVSGLYVQGASKQFLSNPAAATHHYGMIAGTHYYHKETKQIFGIAIDFGVGDSITNNQKLLKSDHKSGQVSLYYNKTFDNDFKFNLHTNFMRSSDRHQRPVDDNGNQLLALSHGKTYEISVYTELNYKHKISKLSHIKPFIGANYTYTKQFAYKESNVGIHNMLYKTANMSQVGICLGIKGNLSYKIDDAKLLDVLPKISYTNYVKQGRMKQLAENINSGQQQVNISGTYGKHLLSSSLGIGLLNTEAESYYRFSYTNNLQKYATSNELLFDLSWRM